MPEFEVKQEDAVRARPSSGPAGRGATLREWFADVKREVDRKPKPEWLLRLEPQVDDLDRKAGAGSGRSSAW